MHLSFSKVALRLLALVFLLGLFALLSLGSRQLSFTMDEPSHLAAGYAWLARGEAGLWTMHTRAHPLLVDAWEALPLYLANPDLPLESFPGWQVHYERYLESFTLYLQPAERSEVAGRTPAMLLTVLLAAVVFRWAADLGGGWAGLFALGIMVFDPNLLAHGRLATNDLGVTALGLLALYAGGRWIRRPSWPRSIVVGGLVTVAMLSKGTGVLYAAVLGIQMVVIGILERRPARFWLQAALLTGTSCILLWAAYGFAVGMVPGISVLLPAPLHWESLLLQSASAEHRLVFALGMRYGGRRWWYFPLAFLIKNPLPLLVGVVGALGRAVMHWHGCKRHWERLSLWLFPVLYTMIIISKGMNIGYRHLLPIHPFFYLWIGTSLVAPLRRRPWWIGTFLGLLMLWYGVGTLQVFPHELTYFNELVGGSGQGYHYLVDSNLDWGQSYKALQAWLEVNPGPLPKRVSFSFHSSLYPLKAESLVFQQDDDAAPLAPYAPSPGRYILEASLLQGVFGPHAGEDWFAWFRNVEPTAQIANAVFVYDVPSYDGEWVAHCMSPARVLSPNKIATRIGTAVREVRFDCTTAWVYPAAVRTPGWYLVRGENFNLGFKDLLYNQPPTFPDSFHARHFDGNRLAYLHAELSNLPPFALYEAVVRPVISMDTIAISAPVATSPAGLAGQTTVALPISLDGPLDFMGIRVYLENDTLEVETWWQFTADQEEDSRPFSIMAHLLTLAGENLGVVDGLGVTLSTIRKGDILVQRHRFPLPAGTQAELWFRTGAYWLDTMKLWSVEGGAGEEDALFVALGALR